MRWRFPQYQTKAELEQRREYLSRIDSWWEAFRGNAERISDQWDIKGAPEFDLPRFMSEKLQQVDRMIMWEYGPAVNGPGHRLVITPESEHGLRAMVESLVERAPEISGWEFYDSRLPESVTLAEASVSGRTGGWLDGVKVRVERDQHNLIGLTYFHSDFSGPDDQTGQHLAFVATESLLGESCLNHWIGFIECERFSSGGLFRRKQTPPGLIGLDDLKPRVEAEIQTCLDQLPDQALREMRLLDENAEAVPGFTEWSLLKMEPPQKIDYAARSDMFVATTAWVDCFSATHGRRPFSSRRFSKHGEVFCYLKTDGREGFTGEKWDDKGELEDDLQVALDEVGVGCVWGGGTGRIYSYVEFALTDVTAGVEAIRRVLQQGRIHRRTWILFHDQDMQDEWIGAYDDTPKPPSDAE
ncbi:MAG: hypothetical protein AAF916_06795 [Planctomycetota bacterium]